MEGVSLSDSSSSNPIILYVGLEATGAAPVLARLHDSGANAHLAANVYLALARWGRGTVRPAAVIVCVDYLQPADFEFFTLASRDHARTPVYVCGRPEAAAKLDRAMRCGARGTITSADVDELICEFDSRDHAKAAVVSEPSPAEPVLRIEPPADAPVPAPEPDDDETLTDEDAAEPTAAARVPWKDYGGGPVRVPPVRPSVPPAPQPAPAGSPLDGPLLTAEELEALMRDDFKTMGRESPLGPE